MSLLFPPYTKNNSIFKRPSSQLHKGVILAKQNRGIATLLSAK